MADFDPYYQWLAIPPKDQPPNHYRLLGVELFEPNADAIANAADQRMTHVRSFQSGKHSDLSQKLLNEIAAAQVCLLNPEKRAAYDRQLRQQSSNKKPIWLGIGLLAGAVLVLAAILIVKLSRGGKEVALTETKPPATVATPAEPQPVNPEPRKNLEETVHRAGQRTGPPDNPLKPAVESKPGADSGKPRDTNPQKPADATPSTAGTARPQPVGNPQAAVHESRELPSTKSSPKEPPTKASFPAEQKPKSTEPTERPKEKTMAADAAAAHAKENPQKAGAFVAPKEKLAAPDEATQKHALAIIRETYQASYRAADKVALVHTLLEKADESKRDTIARFALLQEAKNLAAETWQGELAFEIIDTMASEYQIFASQMKAEIIEQAAKRIRSLQQREAVARAALAVMDEAIAEDDVDVARQMGKLATQMARPTKDRELIQQIMMKSKEVEAAAKACADAKEAMATLKEKPTDPNANLVLGKRLCFVKGDWERGLPMLARSNNATFKALAERDLQKPATAEAQVKLGDAWWAARGKQRAAYWYEKAMPGLMKLERDRVAARIVGEPLARRTVDLLAWADPGRNDPDGKWGMWARNGTDVTCISFPPLTDGKQDDCSTLASPVDVNGQYDLLVSFTRNKVGAPGRDEILIDFPVGLHNCALAIGEAGSGLGNIDGKNCYRNSTTISKTKLVDGRRYVLGLSVRRMGDIATIDVLLDYQPFIHWRGMETSLSSVSPYIRQVSGLPLRFFLSTRSLATFHSAELRIVTGKAKWVL